MATFPQPNVPDLLPTVLLKCTYGFATNSNGIPKLFLFPLRAFINSCIAKMLLSEILLFQEYLHFSIIFSSVLSSYKWSFFLIQVSLLKFPCNLCHQKACHIRTPI